MNTEYLKALAQKLYFDNVKNEEYRQGFIDRLNSGTPVIDNRQNGYVCPYCNDYSEKPVAFAETDKVVFANNGTEIHIVNSHYDGCRGWN